MKIRLVLLLAVSYILFSIPAKAQNKYGFSDISIALTDVKHGLPFYKIAPLHPGIEVSTTLLKKEKEKSFHSFDATLGFYHHSLIASSTYSNVKYNYQRQIKNTIGIDLHSGLGYLHSIYPGEGYTFNDGTKEYESIVNHKGYLLINIGFGLAYIKHQRFQPFIHYDLNFYNVWSYATFVNSTAILKAGVKINIQSQNQD